MKRILHVIDTTGPGGAETVFVELADRVRAAGYDSVALLRGDGWVRSTLGGRSVVTHVLDAKGSFNWRFLLALCNLIRREKVDVIQSHLLGSSVYGALAGWLTHRPVVATFHGDVDFAGAGRLHDLKFRVMNHAVSRYVTVSHDLAVRARARGLSPRVQTEIIYNGIDVSRYGKTEEAAALRRELGFPDDAVVVGSLGNIRSAKSYDVLLKAAAHVCSQKPHVRFVVAGASNPASMAPLQRLVDDLRLRERVRFLGFRSDVPAFLGALDVFALSSSSEGFSIATVEAQATGLPVVVTRCGGPEEIVTDQETGLLVPVQDPAALANAIVRLIEEPALAQRLALAGQRAAKERYSASAMVGRYAAIYEQLLDG